MEREITVDARVENIAAVTEFVDGVLAPADCPMRAKMQLDIAIDELFSNIAHYAYGPEGGEVTVRASLGERSLTLVFVDRGAPFDPLGQADPDVTLPAEQREIGGLGIFMVKKSMDELSYERADGENRLKVVKKWGARRYWSGRFAMRWTRTAARCASWAMRPTYCTRWRRRSSRPR